MNDKTSASFFFCVKEEWEIDQLVGLLGKGFVSELQLGSGSENGLKEKQGCEESLHSRFRSPIEDTCSGSCSPGRYVDYKPWAHTSS